MPRFKKRKKKMKFSKYNMRNEILKYRIYFMLI